MEDIVKRTLTALQPYALPIGLGIGLAAGCYYLLVTPKAPAEERHASSFKEAAKALAASYDKKYGKKPNSRALYMGLRVLLREYGVERFEAELVAEGLVKDGRLTTGTKPFNLFARLAAEEMKQPEMDASNALLGEAGSQYLLCCNRKENDEHWQSGARVGGQGVHVGAPPLPHDARPRLALVQLPDHWHRRRRRAGTRHRRAREADRCRGVVGTQACVVTARAGGRRREGGLCVAGVERGGAVDGA